MRRLRLVVLLLRRGPAGSRLVVTAAALRTSRDAAYSPGSADVTAFLDLEGGVLGHGLTDAHGVLHAVVFTAATSGLESAGIGRSRLGGSPGLTGPVGLDGETGPTGPERGAGPDGGVKPSER